MAFIEALNKLLTERLFKVKDAQELNDPENVSSTWVKHLYGFIKLKEVTLVESYPPEDTLLEDGSYCYLLQPIEEHDDQCKRATKIIWPKKTYRLREIMEGPGSWVTYYLSDGPDRAFVSDELMLIPEDTELPPDYIQNGEIIFIHLWINIANGGTREIFVSFHPHRAVVFF